MMSSLFFTVLRTVAIPYVTILFLSQTPLGEQGSFAAVTIALVIITIISVIFKGFRIVGNTIAFRGKRVMILIVNTLIEIIATIGFVVVYQMKFG